MRATPPSRSADPAFAAFLRDRLDLAVDAVDRQVLDRYGEHLDIDGEPTPAWLIANGADASAEAVLGLSAYVAAGGPTEARTTLSRLSEGIAELQGGDARHWPMGSVRPWAESRSVWHAWGGNAPAALADASVVLDEPALADGAVSDSFTFDPWLLTSGGPDNGRLPTRGDASQIAYGADSRLQSLLATADADGATTDAASGLAGIVAAWYFGANPAGEPMYDPATGRTFDGISASGQINRNSGAESTIHGLLSMIALDQHPAVAELARTDGIVTRQGTAHPRGGGRHPRRRRLGHRAALTVDRRVALQRLRVRRPRRRRLHDAGAAGPPSLARAAGVRPAARERCGHHASARTSSCSAGSRPARSARRATPRPRERCCR